MTHKRFILRMLTLLGLVLSALILTMAMLTFVQAQGPPSIAITKVADQTAVRSGAIVTFTITITNTGGVTLTNVTVSDALAPDCDNDLPDDLAPHGGSTSYECSINVAADFTNTATVTGTSVPTGTHVTDTDTAFVDVINPAIEISKTPDTQAVVSGSTATFTIIITNTGDVTLTNVIVSDALAPNCDNGGLSDLAPDGASTSYQCTLANVTADFTNSATVTGTPPVGDVVTDIDTASVDVINPAIEISKTPDEQTVTSGSDVTFNIRVENTGDVDLTGVTVTDAQAPDCDRTIGILADGASTNYSCEVTNVTDGFINSAIATGTSQQGGHVVTDADAAKVKLDETQACPTDMLAYWKLDETSGSTYDDFYDGHDGGCAGQCPIPATGHVNGGQEFDGSNTGIDVPTVPGDDSFNWGVNDSFSIEFWMQTDSASTCAGNEVIVGRDDSSTDLHWWVGCWGGGQAAFCLIDTGGQGYSVIGTTDLADGSWHHVVAVRDASAHEIHIYVDGTVEKSTTGTSYTAGFGSSTAALNIGWLNLAGGFHFDGTVDEVALYDEALSSDEIRQHRNEGLAGRWYCQSGTYGPVIVSTPVTEAPSGRLYTYDVEAVGDPVPITYTLGLYPNGMTIDQATGLISWTPTVAQEGNHNVEVEASNSVDTDTQSFTIFVSEGTLCPPDMIAYWKLDESSGSTYDDFYDGHDGECAGQCPTPATGCVNGAQVFDGATTGIDIPAETSFDWGKDDSFSIEFWMKRPGACAAYDVPHNEVIAGRDDSSTLLHWWVGVSCKDHGKALFGLIDTDGGEDDAWAVGDTVVTGGAWHHIVAVRDGDAGKISIYVDSTEEASASATFSAGFDSATAPLNLGWLNLSGGYHFEGTLDEVALYDRALSSDEIQQHYNEGGSGPGYCINPDITVNKTASPAVVSPSDTVTYTYAVMINPGDAPLSYVTLSDDKCSPVTFLGGDDDGDSVLDKDELWTYNCSMPLSADITNTVTVTGNHSLGGTVSGMDTAFVEVGASSHQIFLPIILKD